MVEKRSYHPIQKNKIMKYLVIILMLVSLNACSQSPDSSTNHENKNQYEIVKSEQEWKAELTSEEFEVLRNKGTERAFTGDLLDKKAKGTYVCAACSNALFDSDTKFESGTGWPSFYTAIGDTNVVEETDTSFGWNRVEVLCGKCGGHLGHVFEDGPKPTGLRYCVNSVSLDFEPAK